ncbi:MAG TPA: sugar phosphate isomerase/epimerase [Planctomycetota bacterium]|nr:sugar phosphate isomerase/epimerase [Planctomycetota bacterium]
MKKLNAALTLAALAAIFTVTARAGTIPDEYKIGGFALACQAWSFNRFSAMEAIEKTAATGARCIEFFPGQKLSKEEPTVKWDHNASDEVIAKVKAKLAEHKIKAVNYGVVGVPADEAGARKIFEFAKKMDLYGITTESHGSIEVLEKLAKEYDIRVCFHEHPRREKDPTYKIWNPHFVAELCKDRDPRVGACADTGHWQTSALKPLDCIKILTGRVLSSHLKDRAEFGKGGPDIVYGTGQGQIAEVLAELKAQKFEGNISIEYENKWDNNVPDMKECVEFVRKWGEANK